LKKQKLFFTTSRISFNINFDRDLFPDCFPSIYVKAVKKIFSHLQLTENKNLKIFLLERAKVSSCKNKVFFALPKSNSLSSDDDVSLICYCCGI